MTAIYLDGFDHYGALTVGNANMLQGAYATATGLGPDVPAFGTRTGNLSLSNNSAGLFRYVLPATKSTIILSCGFAVDALPGSNSSNRIIDFNDATNNVFAALYVTSTGVIELTQPDAFGNPGTILASTQGPVIRSQTWHFLEMEFSQSGGTFVLRVDDATGTATPVINASGLSLGSLPVAQLQLLSNPSASGRVRSWMDDLFIRDTSGSVNSGFLGDRRVATLLADADTATQGWSSRFYQKLGAGILNNTAANAGVSAATSTSLNVGSGDFTIEQFVRWQSLPTGSNKSVIFGKWDETGNTRSYQLFLGSVALNSGSLCFQTSTDGSVSTVQQPIVYPFTPELNTWYHIAIVRASSQDLLFVNGQQLGLPISDSRTYFAGAAPLGIGAQFETAGGRIVNTSHTGWLDEMRFTVGFARYTSNFTPTTTEFPRNVGGDPQFADVSLLAGFDSTIQDESSFTRTLTATGAVQQTVNDGPSIGNWSTIGKAVPDDNTFVEAPLLPATSILTLSANPANADTVTIHGAVSQAYTFKTALASAFDVLIDSNVQNTLQNLFNAINAGAGSGTKYGTGTTANVDVNATQLPAGQMQIIANAAGTSGNAIATTSSLTHGGGWTGSTMSGGTSIPGPSNFKVQRPPPLTTIISAMQITQRAFKSDAGLASINSAFVGPLGGVLTGSTHSLAVSPDYISDIYETDPDTAGPISPTTIINGAIQLNRDT
jgi:hypothetical protein